MADHGTVEIGTATGVNYADHLDTYEGFLGFTKYGTIAVTVVLILMAFFLL